MLSPDERRKFERFKSDSAALLYLVAHAVLRQVLEGIEPGLFRDADFTLNAFGKPLVDDTPSGRPLHCNISHAWPLVAVVVTRHAPCGVDIELCDGKGDWRQLLPLVLQPHERDAVLSASDPEWAFICRWTLKEAVVKTLGVGLSWDFAGFSVCPVRGIAIDDAGVAADVALCCHPCSLFGGTLRGALAVGCASGRDRMPPIVFHSLTQSGHPAPPEKEIPCMT